MSRQAVHYKETRYWHKSSEKRTPCKILPYALLIHAIQRILLRQGKWEDFQHWRGPGDEPGQFPPLGEAEQFDLRGIHAPMHDVYDGWAWGAIQAGLERRRGGRWGMEDVNVQQVTQRFVSLPCGLVLAINIDWFQTIKGSIHSTGAMYATIINNPRAVRFLEEETILVCVIPGPHEPSLEQINHIIEPFIRDVNTLYGGKSSLQQRTAYLR
ncbi:hypothetical protein JB92DRAFT_3117700 [Gautieria morchelliformis]|nr:hypothetical protein JB92DRAFT_3117700 [Gautieria morchelliformis]